ncbi:unnamed protein product, partial [Staurois parvus]
MKIEEDRVRDQPEPVKRRRAAREGRQLMGKCLCGFMLAVDGRGRGSPGWSRGQHSNVSITVVSG